MKSRAKLKQVVPSIVEPTGTPEPVDAAALPVPRLKSVTPDASRDVEPFGALGAQQEIEIDGRRMVFTAQQEIVLRCGKSSITLTRAGKIIISGEYVVSRSSGVNRIRGGSVQIN